MKVFSGANSWQDQRDVAWRKMVVSARYGDILSEIEMLPTDEVGANLPFILSWRAKVANLTGSYDDALSLSTRACNLTAQAEQRYGYAIALSNLGLANLGKERLVEAKDSLEEAAQILRDLDSKWALKAVLINLATCEFQLEFNQAGLRILNEAEAIEPETEIDLVEAPLRVAQIAANRASVLASLPIGETREAIGLLLQARQIGRALDNDTVLAPIYLNLAMLYNRLGQYGSGLLAAQTAAQLFAASGNAGWHKRARMQTLTCLAYLGQGEKCCIMIDDLISVYGETDTELVETVARTVRIQHRKGSRVIQERYANLIQREVERDAWRKRIVDRLDELQTLTDYSSEYMDEAEGLVRELENEATAQNDKTIAWFQRAIHEAHRNPGVYSRLPPELARYVDGLAGSVGQDIEAAVHAYHAIHAGDTETERGVWLGMLWRDLQAVYRLQSEDFRSEYLDSHRLDLALDFALRTDDAECLMEIMETVRIDAVMPGPAASSLGLPSFDSLEPTIIATLGGAPAVQHLSQPQALAVNGRSRIGSAVSSAAPAIDLDELRQHLGGEDAIWWSTIIVDNLYYWALMTPEGVTGGSVELTQEFYDALSDHSKMLPVILDSDRTVYQSMTQREVRAVSIARSAGGPMAGLRDVKSAAINVLPSEHRRNAEAYCDAVTGSRLDGVYAAISKFLLPPQLKDVLGDEEKYLICSVAPELATIPIGLLPVSSREVVVQRAAIQYAPPAGLASRIRRRLTNRSEPARRPYVLAVTDTLGDLAGSTGNAQSGSAGIVLSSWSNAAEIGSVGRASEVLRRLEGNHFGQLRPGVMSVCGHLVAGVRERPGLSAVVCAPENPGDLPSLLTARDLLELPACFPSHIYLGGCEGTGLGTGLEWVSIAAAVLDRGAECSLSHSWPIIDSPIMTGVDATIIEIFCNSVDVGHAIAAQVRSWLSEWRRGVSDAPPPHFWAGLQLIGLRSGLERAHQFAAQP
jgi:tetratricopeptide (TPR) repeat protein